MFDAGSLNLRVLSENPGICVHLLVLIALLMIIDSDNIAFNNYKLFYQNPIKRLGISIAVLWLLCLFIGVYKKRKADPVGFEPTTPGLEARCYVLAKPRDRLYY